MSKNSVIMRMSFGLVFMALAAVSIGAGEITYEAGKRRDPFIPLNPEDSAFLNTASSGVRLEGIIYDPGVRSMVILSGKAYQTGDEVGEAKVVSIRKDHVVISVAGEEKTLWIREAEKN